jgi:hypothetical protein
MKQLLWMGLGALISAAIGYATAQQGPNQLIGCVFNTVAPTLSNGQSSVLQCDVVRAFWILLGFCVVSALAAPALHFLGGGIFRSTPPTLSDKQQATVRVNSSGQLVTDIVTGPCSTVAVGGVIDLSSGCVQAMFGGL